MKSCQVYLNRLRALLLHVTNKEGEGLVFNPSSKHGEQIIRELGAGKSIKIRPSRIYFRNKTQKLESMTKKNPALEDWIDELGLKIV